MGLAYILVVVWLLVLVGLVLVTLMYTMAWLQCDTIPENQCIDYNQFGKLCYNIVHSDIIVNIYLNLYWN